VSDRLPVDAGSNPTGTAARLWTVARYSECNCPIIAQTYTGGQNEEDCMEEREEEAGSAEGDGG
jgi:hypothetical protein